MSAVQYLNELWSPEVDETQGYVLRSTGSKRVLLVDNRGVHECSRDGNDTPRELIDCNPEIVERVRAALS